MSEDEKLGYLHKIDGAEFVRCLRDNVNRGDCPITFFLAAGCSVSSGIMASRGLVRDDWLPILRKIRGGPPGQSVDEWAMEQVPGYDLEIPAGSYGRVHRIAVPRK